MQRKNSANGKIREPEEKRGGGRPGARNRHMGKKGTNAGEKKSWGIKKVVPRRGYRQKLCGLINKGRASNGSSEAVETK